MFIFRNYTSTTLIPVIGLYVLLVFAACSLEDPAKEYFESHGYSYPSDVSGVSMFGLKYAGVAGEELREPGAREYVHDGIMVIKEYFHKKKFGDYSGDVNAIMVSDPVLYRAESGEIGIMVKVTGYGSGKTGSGMKLHIKWVENDKELWKAENFAYFNRRGLDQWTHGGWVF